MSGSCCLCRTWEQHTSQLERSSVGCRAEAEAEVLGGYLEKTTTTLLDADVGWLLSQGHEDTVVLHRR